MTRTRRDHYLSRQPRDDRADPWVADAITRPPGTEHIWRALTKPEAADFAGALYRSARHHGISCSASVVPDGDGWAVTYQLWPKHAGRAHVKSRKAGGETLAYDKIMED